MSLPASSHLNDTRTWPVVAVCVWSTQHQCPVPLPAPSQVGAHSIRSRAHTPNTRRHSDVKHGQSKQETSLIRGSVQQASELSRPRFNVTQRYPTAISVKDGPEKGVPPTPALLGPMNTTYLALDSALMTSQNVIIEAMATDAAGPRDSANANALLCTPVYAASDTSSAACIT